MIRYLHDRNLILLQIPYQGKKLLRQLDMRLQFQSRPDHVKAKAMAEISLGKFGFLPDKVEVQTPDEQLLVYQVHRNEQGIQVQPLDAK